MPAWNTDIDHTVPYPAGPTHPSNLKCLCRAHHLLKTFHAGWTDTQLPTGTVVWTSPTGHTYTTEPEGAHWFPILGDPTGEPDLAVPDAPNPRRCLKMPIRKRTRRQDHTHRVASERAANQKRLEQRSQEPEAEPAANYEPPPF